MNSEILIVYCTLAVIASLFGGFLPTLIELTHLRRQLMMSLVSGVLLGVSLLHMLPHASEHLHSISWVGGAMLSGLLVMFFLLRVFHVHAHDSPTHEHSCDHQHHSEHESRIRLSWIGLFVGLTIHSLLDGVALAASVFAAHHHSAFVGFGTFLAVFLHKPLDSLTIATLMHTSKSKTTVNLIFALTCPVGALLFWIGTSYVVVDAEVQHTIIGLALAFSAGFFLCIALSDLLPEVAFHSHDRVKLSAALLLGVAISVGVEMSHSHGHDHQSPRHSNAFDANPNN